MTKSLYQNDICPGCGGVTRYYHGTLGYEAHVCDQCKEHWSDTSVEDHERHLREYKEGIRNSRPMKVSFVKKCEEVVIQIGVEVGSYSSSKVASDGPFEIFEGTRVINIHGYDVDLHVNIFDAEMIGRIREYPKSDRPRIAMKEVILAVSEEGQLGELLKKLHDATFERGVRRGKEIKQKEIQEVLGL